MNIVLLAGGGGTRLWPLSRRDRPKQFQSLFGDHSLMEQTLGRIQGEIPNEKIFVATGRDYVEQIKRRFPLITDHQFIIEPEKRDTGPAMGAAAATLFRRDPDEPMAFLPCDHLIKDRDSFLRCLRVADKLIRSTGKMVDIGVIPTSPNVNLGYTHVGRVIDNVDGVPVMEFKGHTEKPPLEIAKNYLASGEYLWHANYYMWTPAKFLHAFEQTAPQMYEQLRIIAKSDNAASREQAFKRCEKISFDYAVTEHLDAKEVLIIPAPFDWSDVGLWSVVKQKQEENAEDNVTRGEVLALESENCLIYGQKKKMIATIGLKDLVVVDTEDALLICPMDRDQDVKKLVDAMNDLNQQEYL